MASSQQQPAPQVVLSLQGVSRQYGAVHALRDVSLECRAGEIHAVVGENGSGKSTLLGVASGFVDPDKGTVHIGGKRLSHDSPSEARRLGLGMAYQEVSLVLPLSVKENLYLAAPKSQRPSYHGMKDWAIDLLARYELDDLFADMPVAYLTVGERQLLEVAKALLSNPKVLLLDEPTTAMGPSQVNWLHRTILDCAKRGMSVVYVSHRLPEVLSVTNRVTVLRDGRSQGTHDASGMAESDLVALMIGRSFASAFPQRVNPVDADDDLLVIRDLQGGLCGPISLSVGRGEILGVAGVEGNGQGDFFATLCGKIPPKRGIVTLGGKHVDLTSPVAALKSGIMLLAGDRKRESLFPMLSVRSNATIQVLRKFSTMGWLRLGQEKQAVGEMAERLKIRTPSLEQPVSFLSGGNQQKVALARTHLRESVRVVLADEPTQGVDVRSRFDIYEALRAKADEGAAIIVKSSDPIELSGFCDRVIVMSRGQIIREIPREQLSEHTIIEAIVGGINVSLPDAGKSIGEQVAEKAGEGDKLRALEAEMNEIVAQEDADAESP
jgi:ribose transport system ATP-binding protein